MKAAPVYEQALTSLINNWRKTFNDEDLPFVVVQLPTANFAKIYSTIRIGTGVRAGQWNVSQRMDNVKTVVSNDTELQIMFTQMIKDLLLTEQLLI